MDDLLRELQELLNKYDAVIELKHSKDIATVSMIRNVSVMPDRFYIMSARNEEVRL